MILYLGSYTLQLEKPCKVSLSNLFMFAKPDWGSSNLRYFGDADWAKPNVASALEQTV